MSEVLKVSTEVLKVHPRNKEFFDDIDGQAYEQFKKSIEEDGVITPLIVAPDMTVVSGHQRLKASKDLGITKVPILIRDDLDDEEAKLKTLLATNFGRIKNDVNKMRKVAVEYVELCGNKHGGERASGDNRHLITQDEIAQQLGINPRTLRELLEIERKLTPEIKQLLDDGMISKTSASKIWVKLSEQEQSELLEELGQDKISEMTQKQMQQYIEENNKLKKQLEQEKNKPKEKEYITDTIDNTDYTVVSKLKKIEQELKEKAIESDRFKTRLELMTDKADAYEKDSLAYQKMKEDITYLTKQKDDLGRKIQAVTDISGLVVEIDHLVKEKLAPIRYSKSLLEAKDDEIVLRNITNIVQTVQQWCDEIKEYIPNKINYVEVIE